MTMLTRRSFLKQSSVSAATLGLLPAIPLAAMPPASEAAKLELPATIATPMVVSVSDVTTGEVTLLVGHREIVFHDRRLVSRLLKAAR
jgi:hypothetical protein